MTEIIPPRATKAAPERPSPGFVPPYFFYGQEEHIDIVALVRALWDERRAVAWISAAATLIALAVALTTTPVYRAEVLLAPVQQDKSDGMGALLGQLGDFATLLGTYVGPGKDRTAESIATLKSRSLAIQFIATHNLKQILFARDWDAADSRWRVAPPPTDLEAFDMFDKGVRRIEIDRRTGLVTLAMEWTDPVRAANWANSMVKEVNARRRAEAIAEARNSIEYLERQLAKNSSVEVQQAIYRLIEAQTKSMALANTREEYAFRVIDPAVVPERRIRPKRAMLVGVGFVLGVFAGIAFVLLRRSFAGSRR